MENDTQSNRRMILSLALLSITIGSLLLISFHQEGRSEVVTVLMCALSSMSIGIVIGFLFGIPKTDSKTEEKNIEKQGKRLFSKRPNTNLEEISDWLTKIIIGVSLVEFQNISSSLNTAAGEIAKSMGEPVKHQAYVMALLIFYLMFGFLVGYLLTRVFLAHLFSEADIAIEQLNTIENRLEITESRISDHSEVESLVAQAEYYINKFEESDLPPNDKNKWLDMSEAILNITIHIDENNIPAHIGLSKCFSDRNDQEKAWKKLEELEVKLKESQINPKTHARISYNKACYYFLYAKSKTDEERKEKVGKAFSLLNEVIKEEASFIES